MNRDHEPVRIAEFGGLFDNGEATEVPFDHFLSCQNLEFTKRGVKTRRGSSLSLTKANIRRIKIYRIIGQAQRLLVLDNAGNLYDSTDLVTPILTVVGMTDFSVSVLYGRAYITPHDGIKGLAGEFVYVYSGSGIARKAGGITPTGFNLIAADSALSGNIEAGYHAIGVCFETDTGFLTPPGGFVAFSAVGGKKLDISNVGIGPSYVVARQLVMTKIITEWDGDFNNQEYFLVPSAMGGRIGNNTGTTATLDAFDADLQSSADYLLGLLTEIPAGVCINGTSKGRMMVGGENLNQSTARVSRPGEPESFNSTEGFFNVNPGDAGTGIKYLFEHKAGLIVALKSQRSYATSDNGEEAAFWGVDGLDMSVGGEPHSIGRILDYGESLEDIAIVADRSGLHVFNGTFALAALSRDIDDLWSRINKAYFHTVEVLVDPLEFKLYVLAPLDSATAPSHILFADFRNGLNAEKIRWCPWVFPVAPQSAVVDINTTTQASYFRFAGYTGNVYNLDTSVLNDFGTAIDNWAEFPLLPHETSEAEEGTYHFGGVRLRARGSGVLLITGKGLDDTPTFTAPSITLAASPGIEPFQLLDFTAPKCSVKLRLVNADEWFLLTKFTLLVKWVWGENPT